MSNVYGIAIEAYLFNDNTPVINKLPAHWRPIQQFFCQNKRTACGWMAKS
jgi:hypothetical protein